MKISLNFQVGTMNVERIEVESYEHGSRVAIICRKVTRLPI